MNGAKHTPGPWSIKNDYECDATRSAVTIERVE